VSSDRLWSSDDAYLLGDALLVAPATREGCRSRPVPLPDGDWYRWRALPPMDTGDGDEVDTLERLVGTRTVELDTPAGQPLVLVRAGTVLPLDDGWAADGTADDGMLAPGHGARRPAVHCFASAEGRATGGSYDDAGDGFGPGRVDRFNLAAGPSGPVLGWGRDGAFPAPERLRVVVHGLSATRALADGLAVEATVWRDRRGQATTSVECAPFDELRFEL
jgi:alpha-glucosidase